MILLSVLLNPVCFWLTIYRTLRFRRPSAWASVLRISPVVGHDFEVKSTTPRFVVVQCQRCGYRAFLNLPENDQ